VIATGCQLGAPIGGLAESGCPLSAAGGLASSLTTSLTLAPLVAWVVGGATFALHATSQVLGETTSPQLSSTWFSTTYWRVAAIAAVLTLPFLFAAAVQALIRCDLSLLLRASLGYLPLAALAVAVAAPLTMLLLAASDQLSATVSSAAGQQVAHFLAHSISLLAAVGVTLYSPFVVFLVGLLTVAGALMLWIELLVREAAVYVIVLLLPLAFAAFVWPARRAWAIRSVEMLIALILSKFAIVAVLSLGGAALDQSAGRSLTGLLAGGVLTSLAAFAPWAVLRLIPLAELASAAAGSLRTGSQEALLRVQQSDAWASEVNHWSLKIAQMRDQSGWGRGRSQGADTTPAPSRPPTPETPPPTVATPTEPTGPTEPSTPTEPTGPTEPSTPAEPTGPTEPTTPAEPIGPTEPPPPDPNAFGGLPSTAVRDIEAEARGEESGPRRPTEPGRPTASR
jgi:hypothetical protein